MAVCGKRPRNGSLFFFTKPRPQRPTLFPYTTLFRSWAPCVGRFPLRMTKFVVVTGGVLSGLDELRQDRKSTRLNSSHSQISYAVFCLKKKKKADGYGS